MIKKYDITDYLKNDKELQKAVIEELLKDNTELKALVAQRDASVTAQTGIILELKAENERLKLDCDMYRTFYRAKHNDIKGILFKYRQTLQEIQKIAEIGLDKYHNGLILAKPIIDLINKAEEE